MPGNTEPKKPKDFEEVTAVRKIDEETWEGIYPLRLPLPGARGVYGGHTCAQTLLVAMESAPGYIPHSFHSSFIRPGDSKLICLYKVKPYGKDGLFCQRQIFLLQDNVVTYTAMCSLVKHTRVEDSDSRHLRIVCLVPEADLKYNDPSKLYKTYHTDFIVNAYSDEFLRYEICPEERNLPISERLISLWSKIHQPQKRRMIDPKFNYVGLAYLSDGAILTTLARALHLDWNPTVDNTEEEFDETKDARSIMNFTLNAMHIFHYTAMSLDHHLYFHLDDYDEFDVVNEWVSLKYQYRVSKNSRTLVRGNFFLNNGKCVATFVQEGLTYMRPGVPGKSGQKFSKI